CTGEIFLLQNGTQTLLMDTNLSISSFGEDEDGEIYVVGIGGTVQRFTNPNAMPPGSFQIGRAFIRRRSTGVVLDPITVQSNGKKYDIVVNQAMFSALSEGASVLVNGIALNTVSTINDVGQPIFVAKLKRPMLSTAGPLVVEVLRTDGSRSN